MRHRRIIAKIRAERAAGVSAGYLAGEAREFHRVARVASIGFRILLPWCVAGRNRSRRP